MTTSEILPRLIGTFQEEFRIGDYMFDASGSLLALRDTADTTDRTLQVHGIKITDSPTDGYVLTSDSNGRGTWKALSTTAGGTPLVITKQTIQTRTRIAYATLSADGPFTFNDIPQGYTDLEIELMALSSTTGDTGSNLWFNDDETHSNYRSIDVYGGSGTGSAIRNSENAIAWVGRSSASPYFTHMRIRIPQYSSSTLAKTADASHAYAPGESGYIAMTHLVWTGSNRTNAITKIKLDGYDARTYLTGSMAVLYGVKLSDVVTDVAGSVNRYVLIQDQKSQGTSGGTFTSGSWQTRDLNTIAADTIGSVTLNSNQFTLPSGTYRITAHIPAYAVNAHQARLYNVTDSSVTVIGTTARSGSSDAVISNSVIAGRFTIAGSKAFRIEHQCSQTAADNGMGIAANFGGEVYSTVELIRE